MAYVYTIKKRNEKKARIKTKKMETRWLLTSLAMAAGMLAYPFGIGEAEIVQKDGTTIAPSGNVYNIDPEGVSNEFAYNRFQKFALDEGYIANLNFKEASTLANLVNSKITIDGIVNAVKNEKIDGHLIFLSPDGIAIGTKGVINAGNFTGIVPAKTDFETLYNTNNPATDITLAKVEALRDGTSYASGKSIDISGQINTHSGVMLGAGIINIKDGSKLQSTKNLDFKELVNIKDGNNVSANANLGDLTAVAGTGGDIILMAKQASDVKDTKTGKDANGNDITEANPIRWSQRSTDLSAAINIGTDAATKGVSINSSAGTVKLTAESTSTYEDSTPMTLTDTLKGIVLGEDTIVDGLLNKLASKEASANKYLYVNYSGKKNKSAINIGQKSSLEGQSIDIAATSKVEIKQSVAVPSQGKDSNGNSVENTSAMPVAAVAISRVYNTADVVIDGNLTANGADAETGDGIKIAANADTKAELSATAGGGANTSAVVGVAVLTGDTKSKVTVNAPTDATALTASNGKVSVGADSTSDINVNVNAIGQTSYVVSNVGVVNYDTDADVLMERSINAGAVDIKAATNTTGMKLTVDNEAKSDASDKKNTAEASQEEQNQDDEAANAEKNKPDSEKSQDEKNSEKKSIDPNKVLKDANVDTNDAKTNDAAGTDGKGGVKDVKDKLEGTNEGGDNAKKNSAFGLGAAVGVVSNKNDANITIGKNAVITATKVSDAVDGSVKVSADSLMTASKENEDSLGFKVNNTQANANAEIGAAVLVSNVKNDVKIVLDNEGDKSAQIKGTEVSLDASAGMGKYNKTENEEKDSTLSYNVSAKGTAENDTPSKFALDGSVGINTLKNNAVVLVGQKSKVDGSSVKLSADATTNAEGTYGATEENGKVGIGATVGLQNIRGNALVMAGKGAEIKGTESIEASASNSMDLKNQVKNAGKGDSIGISGMVALSYGDSNSVVSLDDETNLITGLATITSTNATNIDNSARSESTGQNGAKAFGIGVGIVNYDVNSLAMISDNGSGITAPLGNTTDAEKAAKKIYEDGALARSIAGDTLAGKLGNKTANGTKGSITTGGLVGAAITTGMIQNDAKAKVVTADSDDEDENERKDSEKWDKWSKKGKDGSNEARKNTNDLEQDNVESKNESAAPSATGAMGEASKAADPDGKTNAEDAGAAPAADSATSAGASIGIEGSVALTFLGGKTDAILDNVTVKNGTEVEPAPVAAVSLSGMDFLGSITMGGTNIKHSVNADSSETKVGIGGTFAMNSSNRDVDSLIRNTDMPMALMVSNSASKIGIEVAAGMGVSTAEGDGANINGAGVVYYNKAKQDIQALMLNNNVMGASLSNKAISTDFQIAGGLSGIKGSGANTNVGVGGAVAISQLENNLSSGIIGGNYTVSSSVDVEAQKGTTQINGALAGTKGGYGFEGAFAYGSTKNNTHAYIDGATVTGLADSAVNVKAGESPVVKSDTQLSDEKTKSDSKIDSSVGTNPNSIDPTKPYTQIDAGTQSQLKNQFKETTNAALDKEAAAQKTNKDTLDNMGLDTTGESYLDKESAASSLDEDVTKDTDGNITDEGKAAGDAAKDEDEAKGELGQNHSITITAAMGGGWNENVGAGAGIAYNYVKNDIAADIKGSTITADKLTGEASSDSLIVSVGAGVAIGGKTFNGAGSGSWNDLKNDTKVNFENNNITGKDISGQAQTTGSIINIAGEVAGGKGMAMGLSLAYNSLNNTTGAYLKGNTVTLQGEDNSVKLGTISTGKTLAVAGGVDVNISQSVVGAVGTVAINRGVSHTESVIDGKTTGENTKLDNVKELSVTAEELAKRTTVAGSVSVGGKKVGVGGAVAYSTIGSSGNKERLRAEINHADITTTSDGKIEVSTADSKKNNNNELEKSRIITVGAGFGVQWGKNFFNLQGGAAVSDIYKNSFASLNNTNINAGNDSKHPIINVTADTKSKINTVGVGGSIDIATAVRGAAGVAINRMYQNTKAEMATDNGTTAVNAGLTQVRAIGDGDIHSVGVGGLVGVNGHAVFAGSGSYNYIGNNVDAIIKNQNLTSNSSVGVVSQSDDRLYNFAGGFAIGANTKVGVGAAVGINKITGDTNALVSGGSIKASGTDTIKVSRPSDDKIFKVEALNVSTTRDGLSSSRSDITKSGVVVDSSATHTLISQLSSGGVAASSSVGINVDGTVNLNTIEGKTTAKIQDADLNSADKYSDVNVNAIDYANFGSFTGTPSIGAGAPLGLSIGVSANWETLDRTTEAAISSDGQQKNVYAKDLTVNAIAKHGSSALSFAAAAGGGKVGISSGDSIMRHKYSNITKALMNNVNAIFDGTAEIKAEHLGNSHTQNVGATLAAGMAAVGIGAGVSVMDDTSTVKAEVTESTLKAKASEAGKNISVLAKNENNWKSTLVTASAAVGIGAGLAANVGINNSAGETAALVTNSQLEAYDVNVNATDKLTGNSIGGVGALGVGGVGVSVALNNINRSVSTHVTGGSVKAANNIDVKAEAERKFDSSVTGVAVGGIGVGVNVAVTSINKGITDAQLSGATDDKGNSMGTDSGTKNEINVHLNGTTKDGKTYSGVNGAKGALNVNGAKFFGLKSTDSDLSAARNMSVSLATPTYGDTTPDTRKQGVHTEVSGEALTATGNVNVSAKDTSDVFEKNLDVTVGGGISATVADNIIHTNYDTDVTMNGATITGKNVTVEAKQTQKDKGSEIEVKAGTGAIGIGVGVGYAGIVNKGATDIGITDSTIKGTENVTVSALDESKHKAQILNVGVSSINVTTTFASVENKNNVGVKLGGTNNISAANNITIDAKKANALEAHTQGVGVGGINVAVNHATIEDGEVKDGKRVSGNATAQITGTNGTFTANSFHFGATNDTTAKLSAGNTAVSILGVSRMRGKGIMNMGAEVNVAGGSFNANTVDFAALLGNANGRTLEGNVKGHNVSAVAVAPDAVVLNTDATSKVIVDNSTFADNTNLTLNNQSYVDRKAYIYGVTAGAVAVGNTSADISGKANLTTSLTGKANTTNKLAALQVATYGVNKGKAFADAGGGGIVGYVGAHVSNNSDNTITSSLSGTWDVTDDLWLVAANKDEVRLTASEGHGGIAGVGGTSVDNIITTNTYATVAEGTNITANRVHVGTDNTASTGAYDDTDSKGNKDVQTYTLKDHFGGVISGNRLRSLLDITENGYLTIGKNANITTANLQEYVASSQNTLTNDVQAKGGGAIVVTDAVTENKINIDNQVKVDSGATLSNEKIASKEGIVLSAYDEHSLKAHSDATVVAGVISPLIAKNLTTMNRKSTVDVAGTVESGSSVGLYAGSNKDGVLSNLKADLKAGAYNYSVIPITLPTVDYTITADKGTVDVSGTVRSNGDINAFASGGREEVIKDASKWAWTNGGSSTDKKFLTSDAVSAEESSDQMKKSTVNVTGALIAGTADPIKVTIKGTVADGLTIEAPDNQGNQRVVKGTTQGTFDYANTLGTRLAELNRLIAAYDGDRTNTTQMASYIAERTRIQGEMERLGLTEKDTNGNTVYINSGRSVYYVEIPDITTSGGNINVQANELKGTGKLHANSAPSVTITNDSDAYLKLNNIIMGEQGGKIVYNKDNVIPPNRDEGNAAINSVNVSKAGAAFNEIYGVTNGEAADLLVQNTKTFSGDRTSTISLSSQLAKEIDDSDLTAAEKQQYKADIQAGKMKYTAITDVEVNGKISNFYGNVTINNASGDIRISGGSKERPTGVEGNSVRLIASNGTIAQDYKDGIVNISGDPEKYLDDVANEMKRTINLEGETSSTPTRYENTKISDHNLPDRSKTVTGYIAGRDVYVAATNINVNGLIQSGYKNYVAKVTDSQLETAKTMPANRAAVIQNRTMYKVNDGGATWNDTEKFFDYVPQVYWDPSTNKLVVEDIDTQGGKIYLTGQLASTGDGRILAADGAADIAVTNETALDMNVGNVLNNQREGIITIADTAKDTWTEYKNGQTRSITGYAQYLKEHAADGDPYAGATVDLDNVLSVGNNLTYNTKEHQAYTWVKGTSVETNAKYQHYERRGFWGLVQTADETTLQAWSQNSQPVEPAVQRKLNLPEGAVINQNSTDGLSHVLDHYGKTDLTNGYLYLDGDVTLLSETISDRDHWVRRSGFLGWFKHIYDTWKKGTSTFVRYNYSMNASQPISIGLIGADKGSINIANTNTTGGSINLTGNVANSHNEATLTINSKAGGIFQNDNTVLKSEIVNLSAKDDISNIHIASIGSQDANGNVTDNIKLNAVSTGKGDINITAVGGLSDRKALPGNVEIVALKSQDGNTAFSKEADLGDVTLTAEGNITQSGSDTTVEGRGIYLTSQKGGIGTANQAIQVAGSDLVYSTDRYGAQVNARAKDSIYLTEAANGGNMRVGKIESREGNVKLTVENGGFVDGLPRDDKSSSTDSVTEMVHRWIDAGLIDGEKDAQGNYTYKGAYITGLEKNRDDYKANVELAYENKTQAQWRTEYTDQQTAVRAVYASTEYRTYLSNKAKYDKLTQDERKKLADSGDSAFLVYAKSAEQYSKYSSYASADAYLKDTAAYKYSQYANAADYLAADTTYKDLVNKAANPTFEWTKDMMLFAVSEKLVNPDSGNSTQTEREANVLGKDVTLLATKGTVGTVSDQTTRVNVEELNGNAQIEKMKQLMNVDASDVIVNRDENGNILSFDIMANMPLGVKSTGRLDVEAGGDVSVAGRSNASGDYSDMNIGTIDATKNSANGDVRLYADKGIYNVLADASQTNIIGKNLIIAGGKESIGTSTKSLNVSLSGDLIGARANKSVFIKNMNNNDYLRLGAMYAGDTISVTSEKGFKMSNANEEIAASYINAGKKLEFNTNATTGIVGESDNAIRILNDRAAVNIAAQSAYIRGMGSLALGIQNGTLVLGNINTKGEFRAESDGSISVGREEEKDSLGDTVKSAVTGSINAGDNVTLDATDNLTLDGTVTAGDLDNATKVLTLKAVNGNITQTTKGAITADEVDTFNGKALLLENKDNRFNNIKVDGIVTQSGETPAIDGDVRINDNSDALTFAINRNVKGNVSVQNLRAAGTLTNDGDITATGNIALGAKGSLSQAADTVFSAGKNVELASANSDISQAATAKIQAEKVTTISAKDVALIGETNQFAGLTVQSADKSLPIQGSITVLDNADKLELSVQPVVNGDITVENKKSNGVLQVSSGLQANGDGATADGNITLKSDGSMQTDVKLTAANDVKLTSTSGAMTVGGNISATAGGITAQSNANMQTTGALTAANDVKLTADAGTMTVGGNISTTGGDIIAQSKGNMQTTGVLTAANDVQLTSVSGGMSVDGNVSTAQGDIKLQSNGSMENTGILSSANDIEMKSSAGDVSIQGNISTGMRPATDIDFARGTLVGDYNKLSITAEGSITEKTGVEIKTPLVETFSGKGVSLESENNKFAAYFGDGLTDGRAIDGSVRVVSDYAGDVGEMDDWSIGVGADIHGDAAFTNINANGSLGILMTHPDENQEINVLGGNGAKGNLSLTTGKDITLLGDANAQNDIMIGSTSGGGFYGIGKGMVAGNDVKVSVDNTVHYVGTINAGNDINVSVQNAQSAAAEDGIYIGTLPEGVVTPTRNTEFYAGNKILFDVKGDGNIELDGAIGAYAGTVDVNVSGKGNILIGNEDSANDKTIMAKKDVTIGTNEGHILVAKAIESVDESVSVETGKGEIYIGIDNTPEDKTIIAKKNANIGTDLGTIYILGETVTKDGDIGMKAGKEVYVEGAENGNFIIRDDGKLNSGGGISLTGRNGDITITDDIMAKKGITVNIAEQGHAAFGRDISVTNDVTISTDKGNIMVGHTVNTDAGTVSLQTVSGNISVGKDITAGKDVDISTKLGDVTIGDLNTGDDGDVLSKAGNVSIRTDKGNVGVVKTVTAQTGSVDIASKQGDILIGNNGPDVKTVTAKDNIDLTADDGRIVVYGKTSTEVGDITLSAHRQEYIPGKDNSSFVIDQNGKLEAGGAIHLNVGNGDLHISDRIQAKSDLATELDGKGSVHFDTDVNVTGSVNIKTDEGDINVGHDVQGTKNITMTANKGNINVGATVAADNGNVDLSTTTGNIGIGGNVTANQNVALSTDTGNITVGKEVRSGNSVNVQTSQGDVTIEKAVTAEQGNIGVKVGTGSVTIGDNGPDVETVTAQENINIGVDLGQVKIYGKTSTKAGDISMAAGADQYTPGAQNFIIEQNGLVDSARDINLTGRNGDLHVTDAIQAKRNLNATVKEEGGVFFDKTATLTGDVTVHTEAGQIRIAGQVDGNLVDLSSVRGDITVGGDINSETKVDIGTQTGDITLQNVTAKGDVNVTGDTSNISTKNIASQQNIVVTASQGNIQTEDITAGSNANVAVQNGNIQMHDVTASGNATISNTQQGSINGNNIVSAGTTRVELTNGDLFLNLAEGKAVMVLMENNTEASRVNNVLAEASGATTPDVELTGNYIQLGTLAAKNEKDVFQLSAMGAGNQKLIGGNFYVGSLSAQYGTHMPNLWSNRGYVHVDQGNLAMDDMLAVDKIHLENDQTTLATYGRIPTRDGEQLVYWNNLDMANSKTREYQLYTDGKVRTHRTVLVDADRNYGKLYGDNLSVVDMMRERVTNRHGQYTFDSALLTEPGRLLRESRLFGLESTEVVIQQQNAPSEEIVIE